MKKTAFYYASCAVYVDAEKMMTQYLDPEKVDVEIVHFGEDPSRIEVEKSLE